MKKLERIILVATKLDQKGFRKEASHLDLIANKLAGKYDQDDDEFVEPSTEELLKLDKELDEYEDIDSDEYDQMLDLGGPFDSEDEDLDYTWKGPDTYTETSDYETDAELEDFNALSPEEIKDDLLYYADILDSEVLSDDQAIELSKLMSSIRAILGEPQPGIGGFPRGLKPGSSLSLPMAEAKLKKRK